MKAWSRGQVLGLIGAVATSATSHGQLTYTYMIRSSTPQLALQHQCSMVVGFIYTSFGYPYFCFAWPVTDRPADLAWTLLFQVARHMMSAPHNTRTRRTWCSPLQLRPPPHTRSDTTTHLALTGTRPDTPRRAPEQRRRTPRPLGSGLPSQETKPKPKENDVFNLRSFDLLVHTHADRDARRAPPRRRAALLR